MKIFFCTSWLFSDLEHPDTLPKTIGSARWDTCSMGSIQEVFRSDCWQEATVQRSWSGGEFHQARNSGKCTSPFLSQMCRCASLAPSDLSVSISLTAFCNSACDKGKPNSAAALEMPALVRVPFCSTSMLSKTS